MSGNQSDKLKVFAGRAGLGLARAMCDYLDIPLGLGRTELFPDGELFVKVDEDVRGLLEEQGNAVMVSALTGQGMEVLLEAVDAELLAQGAYPSVAAGP